MGKFEEALDFKVGVMGNEKLHGHDAFYAFVEKFERLERQFRENYEVEELKEYLKRTASKPKQNLEFAEGHLKGRFVTPFAFVGALESDRARDWESERVRVGD